jgi:hypothetical protein
MVDKKKGKKANVKETKISKKKKVEVEEDEEEEEELEENGESDEEIEVSLDDVESEIKKLQNVINGEELVKEVVKVKASKPVGQLKKGDKVKVDGRLLEVDAHYVLMDHGKTKEMTIELFDPKEDKDYQLRYFSDQVENSFEFYVLEEIMYIKQKVKEIEW